MTANQVSIDLMNLRTGDISSVSVGPVFAEFIQDAKALLEHVEDFAHSAPSALAELFGEIKAKKHNGKVDVKATKKSLTERAEYDVFRDAIYAVHPRRQEYLDLRAEIKGKQGEARKQHQRDIDDLRKKIDNDCQYAISKAMMAFIADQFGLDGKANAKGTLQERFERAVKQLGNIKKEADKANPMLAYVIGGMLDAVDSRKAAWANKNAKSKTQSLEAWAQAAASKKKSDKRISKAVAKKVSKRAAERATQGEIVTA